MAARDDAARTILVATVAALLGIGAVMIYSTTARGDGSLVSETFLRQMVYVAFGLVCAFLVGRLDYHAVLERRTLLLAISLVLLTAVLIPGVGTRINGASRWLRLGPVGLQPSEPAKLALVIFLAGFLAGKDRRVTDLKRVFAPSAGITGLMAVLILVEPDIGTAILVAVVAAVVLFVAGARLHHLLTPAVGALPVLMLVVSQGYARHRIDAWIDPWKDPGRTGYHIIQSLIAIGSGGVTGVGLGASKQKLSFLPEAQTDFIYAILAEETGLIGVTLVLAIYFAFAISGVLIAMRAQDFQGQLLAAGITTIVSLQAIINIAVVTQVLPTKGIALPFISAGGSSVVTMLIAAGLLYSIAHTSARGATRPLVS